MEKKITANLFHYCTFPPILHCITMANITTYGFSSPYTVPEVAEPSVDFLEGRQYLSRARNCSLDYPPILSLFSYGSIFSMKLATDLEILNNDANI